MSSFSEMANAERSARMQDRLAGRDAHFATVIEEATAAESPVDYLLDEYPLAEGTFSRARSLVSEFDADQLILLVQLTIIDSDAARQAEDRFTVLSTLAAAFARESETPAGVKQGRGRYDILPRSREDYLEAAFKLQARAAEELVQGLRGA